MGRIDGPVLLEQKGHGRRLQKRQHFILEKARLLLWLSFWRDCMEKLLW
jgi:hypothetical protein